jgi:exosortase A
MKAASEQLPSGDRAAAGFSWPPWPLWLVTVLVAGVFHQHFVWLVRKGWQNEYYGHGFLIPLVSLYLIHRRWGELQRLPREGYGWGLPVVICGLALQLLAVAKDVNFPQGFALVCVITGLVIWLCGWPVAKALAFPLAYLLFAVPMGRFLVDQLAQPMQLMSAQAAGGAAAFLGMPIQVDGTTIDLPDYRFEVAIACSGLKSAIALSALGALFAYAVQGPLWKRWLLFVLSVPAAIVANGFRIWLTLVLARSLGPRAAEGFFHTLSGLVVFLVALLTLFGIGALIGCRTIRDDV